MSRKLTVAGALLVVVIAALAGCGGNGLPDADVGRVGSVVITQAQLDAGVREIQAQNGQVPTAKESAAFKTFQAQVLQYMVTLEVVNQKAAGLNVTVTDQEVQTQIDQLKAQVGGDEIGFQQAMMQQGLTLDAMKTNLRNKLLLQKAFAAVTQGVIIADSAKRAYYDQNKANYKTEETRKIRHILFVPKSISTGAVTTTAGQATSTSTAGSGATTTTTQPTQADWDSALALAQEVRRELANGADFATLAKRYSDDSGSKAQGGDLGDRTMGAAASAFNSAAWSLELNQISQPVKTQDGYELMQVTQITPARQQTFAEVKDQIEARLLYSQRNDVWEKWLAQARKDLKVTYKHGLEPPPTTPSTEQTATTSTSG